jgi:hypothetical protein
MAGSRSVAGLLAAVIVVVGPGVLRAADLRPAAIDGWNRYVAAVERRRALERPAPSRFLALDFLGDPDVRRAALAGTTVVREIDGPSGAGGFDVPDARVHHWIGATLVPGVSLTDLLARLEREPPAVGPGILQSRILARSDGVLRVFLRLQCTRVVTAVFDTEHDVRFTRLSPGRAANVSVATRIVEVANAGTPRERAMRAGEDHGYLWRLNAYWRYEAVDRGVLAECESISLSRSVPFGLEYLAGPLIRGAARESMEQTLDALRRGRS